MATVWKELRLFDDRNRWITLATATLLGVSSFLWYERMGNYPNTRDEAEVRFAMLERLAVRYGYGVDGFLEDYTSTVGFYPSRALYFDEYYAGGTPHVLSVPTALRWLCNDGNGPFVALRPDLNFSEFHRKVEDYPLTEDILSANKFNLPWWRSNMHQGAAYFGDFAYLTNAVYDIRRSQYMNTNMLNEIGRAASAFRWTTGEYFKESGKSVAFWFSEWATNASRMTAVQEAIDKCMTSEPGVGGSGDWDHVPTINEAATSMVCQLHYAATHILYDAFHDPENPVYEAIVDEWIQFEEYLPITLSTNVCGMLLVESAQKVSRFYGPGGEPTRFYFPPLGFTEQDYWQTKYVPLRSVSWTNSLFRWSGRFTNAELYLSAPSGAFTNDYAYEWKHRVAGWEMNGGAALVERNFQCLTNWPVFWP
jgi:hypothetical protein